MMKLWFKEANGLIRHSKSVTQSVSNPGLISETVPLHPSFFQVIYIYITFGHDREEEDTWVSCYRKKGQNVKHFHIPQEK